jgi:hypothetical protein
MYHDARNVDVCLLANHYYPFFSGAGERFRRYAPGLRERGIQLRVITLNREDSISKEMIGSVPVRRMPFHAGEGFSIYSEFVSTYLLRKAIQYFNQNKCWPDVLHVLTHSLSGAYYIGRVRYHGTPCVQSITMMPDIVHSKREQVRHFLHQFTI